MNNQILDFTNKTEIRTTCFKSAGNAYRVISTTVGDDESTIGAAINLLDNGMFELRGEHYHSLEGACRANARTCRRLFY